MMMDFYKAFSMDPEAVKAREEQYKAIQQKAIDEKWCCTCEHYIPVDENLPGFVIAFPECEYGGIAEKTCEKYRREGTGVRNSQWADRIRQRFMKRV